MKKCYPFLLGPCLEVLCAFLLLSRSAGLVMLLLWMFKDICVPILHFSFISYSFKSQAGQVKKTTVLFLIAWTVMLLTAFVSPLSSLFAGLPYFMFRLLWITLCGVIAWVHAVLARHPRVLKNVIVGEAALALVINALLTHYLSPVLATKFAVDGVEIVLLSASAMLVSIYSLLLGRVTTKQYRGVKLVTWLFGVLVSEFVALWLLGAPRSLPIEHGTTTVLWLFTSLLIFAWCLLGGAVNRRRKGKTHADELSAGL